MRFTRFRFRNYRGIKDAALDLSRVPNGAICALVGLNESGKTTVLEAIDNFRSNPKLTIPEPNRRTRSPADFQAMLPIGERAVFNGEISIEATLQLDAADVTQINDYLNETFGSLKWEFQTEFRIDHVITYKDSKKSAINNNWSIKFRGKEGRKKPKNLTGDDWQKAAKFIQAKLPTIMYFPATLLDPPERIYLEHTETKDGAKAIKIADQSFYFQVFCDILKACEPRASVERHVIARFRSNDSADKENLEALLNLASSHLTKTILGEWTNIFGTTLNDSSFRLSISEDEHKQCFVQIKLYSDQRVYRIRERSAGFQWFFAFTLLVAYRIHRRDRVLFLFDEPAANLHPKAQQALLVAFEKLSQQHQFIYSTHSHYLIDPKRLEAAFVVRNEGQDAAIAAISGATESSNITVTPYRTFVGSHPNQAFYFRPIMDALDVIPAPLDFDERMVLVEGKTDYYALELLKKKVKPAVSMRFYPGGGSGSLDALISLMIGWGLNFIVLLDSDKAGEQSRDRYASKFESLVCERVFTLHDFTLDDDIKEIESMFSATDKSLIKETFFPDSPKLSKSQLHAAVQEMLVSHEAWHFQEPTGERFLELFSRIENQFVKLDQKK